MQRAGCRARWRLHGAGHVSVRQRTHPLQERSTQAARTGQRATSLPQGNCCNHLVQLWLWAQGRLLAARHRKNDRSVLNRMELSAMPGAANHTQRGLKCTGMHVLARLRRLTANL